MLRPRISFSHFAAGGRKGGRGGYMPGGYAHTRKKKTKDPWHGDLNTEATKMCAGTRKLKATNH